MDLRFYCGNDANDQAPDKDNESDDSFQSVYEEYTVYDDVYEEYDAEYGDDEHPLAYEGQAELLANPKLDFKTTMVELRVSVPDSYAVPLKSSSTRDGQTLLTSDTVACSRGNNFLNITTFGRYSAGFTPESKGLETHCSGMSVKCSFSIDVRKDYAGISELEHTNMFLNDKVNMIFRVYAYRVDLESYVEQGNADLFREFIREHLNANPELAKARRQLLSPPKREIKSGLPSVCHVTTARDAIANATLELVLQARLHSLRQCISEVNGGTFTVIPIPRISFAIPQREAAVGSFPQLESSVDSWSRTIKLKMPLPTLTTRAIIDGGTQRIEVATANARAMCIANEPGQCTPGPHGMSRGGPRHLLTFEDYVVREPGGVCFEMISDDDQFSDECADLMATIEESGDQVHSCINTTAGKWVSTNGKINSIRCTAYLDVDSYNGKAPPISPQIILRDTFYNDCFRRAPKGYVPDMTKGVCVLPERGCYEADLRTVPGICVGYVFFFGELVLEGTDGVRRAPL